MLNIEYEAITCPICSCENIENIYTKSINDVSIEGIINVKVNLSICKDCGLVFQSPAPTKVSLDEYYAIQSECISEGDEVRPLYHEMYGFIKQNLDYSKIKQILDIGCRRGEMLRLFAKDGKAVLGVEPSPYNAKYVIDKFNIPVLVDMFKEELVDNNSFDLIVLSHILEHVRDPYELVKGLQKKLTCEGYLFISIPYLEASLSEKYYSNIADYFCFQHLQHFTFGQLKYMLGSCNLAVIHHKITESALHIICKNEEIIVNPIPDLYKRNKEIIKDYLVKRNGKLKDILSKMDSMSDKNILIYGAGSHTTQLMQIFDLDKLKITGICDGDKNKQGLIMAGFKVGFFEEFAEKTYEAVIISSKAFENEIYDYLKTKIPNKEILKIYS